MKKTLTDGRTDGQTDRRTDGQTDGQTTDKKVIAKTPGDYVTWVKNLCKDN